MKNKNQPNYQNKKYQKQEKKRVNNSKVVLDDIQTKTQTKTRKSHTTTVDKIQVINEIIWVSFD